MELEETALDDDDEDWDQDPESKEPELAPVEPTESVDEEEPVALAAAEDDVRVEGLAA